MKTIVLSGIAFILAPLIPAVAELSRSTPDPAWWPPPRPPIYPEPLRGQEPKDKKDKDTVEHEEKRHSHAHREHIRNRYPWWTKHRWYDDDRDDRYDSEDWPDEYYRPDDW